MRILLFWLGLLATAFGLFHYLEQHKFAPERLLHAQAGQAQVSADGLAYLNRLRQEVGLQALAYNAELEQAAANHARYLTDHPDEGHDERNRQSPLFTGLRPSERARHAGYLYQGVHENVSTSGRYRDSAQGRDFAVRQQVDGLMTAIYHRFSLLDQEIDEAGAAWADNGKTAAFVVKQGQRAFNRLCGIGRRYAEPGRSYYKEACFNGALVYADEVSQPRRLAYVAYPVGHTAMPEFHGERPDPMPGRSFTGNPVSIAFAEGSARIEMRTFKLYQGQQEVSPVRILTQHNDPNGLFNERQFALFPLQPLAYDTPYRAVFEYEQNGRRETAEWTFRTRKPDYPYFRVNGGERLALQSGQTYFIHWENRWCLQDCPQLTYQQRGGAKLEVLERQIGGIVVRVNGVRGGDVRLMWGKEQDSALMLYLTE